MRIALRPRAPTVGRGLAPALAGLENRKAGWTMSLCIKCPGCQYEVTHTEAARCPECGAAFDREALRSQELARLKLQRESGVELLVLSLVTGFFVVLGLVTSVGMGASAAGIILLVPSISAVPIPIALAYKVARFGPPVVRAIACALLIFYLSPVLLLFLGLFARSCRC